ncbi:serine/threonine-protein kinase [Chondromyces crocatus]|uniref:Protein kinase domain-containing protein n=1 Tax=Chondromyces crocatus TaxID=52 RepID=A0A0K1EFJ3_CHOCO|nr:serine/threonine-protein kinase [Chondromyces crocatus]AKT39630.1 uncharacterized protein CMC5_037790 [Chondromyces crocatus]
MSDPPPPGPASKPPPAAAAHSVGQVISDRYRLVELLARGGMGAVYKAEHLLLRKWVAVKLLHPHTRNLPEHVQRFEREAIAGAHLQHPNIATATDFGKLPDGSYFLVLEYVRGLPLRELMRSGPLPPVRAARIMRQIASALSGAHERGVIHRDLKPNNVMLDPAQGDLVKVVDFGLAKVPLERLDMTDRPTDGRPPHRSITQKNMVFGTVAYMAPEAGGGMDKVDERSDLYALGIILYEMLTGRHPFDATERFELFQAQCTTPPPPFSERAPQLEIPTELEAIVMRLLRKEPPQRFASAHELIDALEEAVPQLRPAPRTSSSPDLTDWKDLPPPSVPSVLVAPTSSRPDEGAARDFAQKLAPPPSERAPFRSSPVLTPPPLPVAPPLTSPTTPTLPTLPAQPSTSATWPGAGRKPRIPLPILAGAVVAVGAILAVVILRSSEDPGAPEIEPGTGASATLSPTAAPNAAPTPGQDRERLVNAYKHQEWASGEEPLMRILQSDPGSLRLPELKQAVPVLAAKILARDDARADQVIEALDKQLGSDGLDMLYEIVAQQLSARGVERALEVLRRPDNASRLSPPLQITLALRDTPCKKKPSLFERAAREGDERTYSVLEALASASCKTQGDRCCIRANPALLRTQKAIRARIGHKP